MRWVPGAKWTVRNKQALEEKHGLEAMFPKQALCNYLRLIWECFSRKSGSHDLFRKIWVEDCKLPGQIYDDCLGSLPEPTESKWQAPLPTRASCNL